MNCLLEVRDDGLGGDGIHTYCYDSVVMSLAVCKNRRSSARINVGKARRRISLQQQYSDKDDVLASGEQKPSTTIFQRLEAKLIVSVSEVDQALADDKNEHSRFYQQINLLCDLISSDTTSFAMDPSLSKGKHPFFH